MTWDEIKTKVQEHEYYYLDVRSTGLTSVMRAELQRQGYSIENELAEDRIRSVGLYKHTGRALELNFVSHPIAPWPTDQKIDRIYEDVDSTLYKILLEK